MIDPVVVRIIVATFSLVIVSLVGAMIVGLFDPRVDNDKIFAFLGPGFEMAVGSFATMLGGRMLGKPSA